MPATPFDRQSDPATEPAAGAADFDQTFATGPRCRLDLSNVSGPIRVRGWEQPVVHVRAVKQRDGVGEAVYQTTTIEARHDGERVAVRTVLAGMPDLGEWEDWWRDLGAAVRSLESLFRGRKLAAVEYEVRVPHQADLMLNGVSSTITVEDVAGEVAIRTVSGDCLLARARGEFDLHSVNGRVVGRELVGRARAHAVSGDVELAGRLDGLRVNTVSGAVALSGPLDTAGRYELTTVSGSASLSLPPTTGASISVQGVSATVGGDLPVAVTSNRRQPGKRQWQGEVNGGGATVRFQTVSGALRLMRLPGEPAPSPPTWAQPAASHHAAAAATVGVAPATPGPLSPPYPPDPPSAPPAAGAEPADEAPDQLAILRRLEAGELGVEEAMRQLDSLREGRS